MKTTDKEKEFYLNKFDPMIRKFAWEFAFQANHNTKTFHFQEFGYLSVDDLIQEGRVILLETLNQFDPDLGNQFSTLLWINLKGRLKEVRRKAYLRNMPGLDDIDLEQESYTSPETDRKNYNYQLGLSVNHKINENTLQPCFESVCLLKICIDEAGPLSKEIINTVFSPLSKTKKTWKRWSKSQLFKKFKDKGYRPKDINFAFSEIKQAIG